MPGYAQPTVEYIDPYSGEPDSYMVNQEINRKKHPIGSEYKLLYSREKRTAYEKKSNKVYREIGGLLFRTGCADLHCGDSEVGDEGIVITADTMLI